MKYQTITEELDDIYAQDMLEGTFDNIHAGLDYIVEKHPQHFDFHVEYKLGGMDGQYPVIIASREETEEEREKRLSNIRTLKSLKDQKEKDEYEEFLKLKKKFEGE